jgi:hypothetical protein
LAGEGSRESEAGAEEAEADVEARTETGTETEAGAEEAQAAMETETGAGARAGYPDGGGKAEDARTAFRRQGNEIQAIVRADSDSDSAELC